MENSIEVACGSYSAMRKIKERGFKALNPKIKKFQIVDKNAKYEIVKVGKLFLLKSDKDLIKIAQCKGLIC